MELACKTAKTPHTDKRVTSDNSSHEFQPIALPFRSLTSSAETVRKASCACGGGCPVCSGVIQPKLTIGQPGDVYEQEADRFASDVVRRISVSQFHGTQSTEFSEEREYKLRRLPIIEQRPVPRVQQQLSGVGLPFPPSLKAALHRARKGGQSLPEPVREFMEQEFDCEFSDVRIHTDSASDNLNRFMRARAFTMGKNIFFSQGAYDPASARGQRQLAHELTHVLHQRDSQVDESVQFDAEGDVLEVLESSIWDGEEAMLQALISIFARIQDYVEDVREAETLLHNLRNNEQHDLYWHFLQTVPEAYQSNLMDMLADSVSQLAEQQLARSRTSGRENPVIEHRRPSPVYVRRVAPEMPSRETAVPLTEAALRAAGRIMEPTSLIMTPEREIPRPPPPETVAPRLREAVVQSLRIGEGARRMAESAGPEPPHRSTPRPPPPETVTPRVQEAVVQSLRIGEGARRMAESAGPEPPHRSTPRPPPPETVTPRVQEAAVQERRQVEWILSPAGRIAPLAMPATSEIEQQRTPEGEESLAVTVFTTAIDTAIGAIPIVGDLVDIAEFALGLFVGIDRWGRRMTGTDLAILGLGALIPYVGGATLRSATRLARSVSNDALLQAADSLSRSERSQLDSLLNSIQTPQGLSLEQIHAFQNMAQGMQVRTGIRAGGGSASIPPGGLSMPLEMTPPAPAPTRPVAAEPVPSESAPVPLPPSHATGEGGSIASRTIVMVIEILSGGQEIPRNTLIDLANRIKQSIHFEAAGSADALAAGRYCVEGYCGQAGRMIRELQQTMGLVSEESMAARMVHIEGEGGGGVHGFVVGRTSGGDYFIFDPTVEQFTSRPRVFEGGASTASHEFVAAREELGSFIAALHGESGLAFLRSQQAFQEALQTYLRLSGGARLRILAGGGPDLE